jgi:hypothetical protein
LGSPAVPKHRCPLTHVLNSSSRSGELVFQTPHLALDFLPSTLCLLALGKGPKLFPQRFKCPSDRSLCLLLGPRHLFSNHSFAFANLNFPVVRRPPANFDAAALFGRAAIFRLSIPLDNDSVLVVVAVVVAIVVAIQIKVHVILDVVLHLDFYDFLLCLSREGGQ